MERTGPRQLGRLAAWEELQEQRQATVRHRGLSLMAQGNHSYNTRRLRGLTWDGETSGERVSCETLATATNRTVVDHLAAGVETARPWARINTLLIQACSVLGAFRAHHTLGSTARRTTDVTGQAGAHALSVDLLTLTVGPTRGWVARISGVCLHSCGTEHSKNMKLGQGGTP